MIHLVYCDKKAKELDQLLSKEKTKILRGATGRKLPYGRVFPHETLYFVENDGSLIIKAFGKVKSVYHSEPLDPKTSETLIMNQQSSLKLSKEQIKRFSGKRYLCIIEVEEVSLLDNPFMYHRQSNMDDWITVNDLKELTTNEERYQSVHFHES